MTGVVSPMSLARTSNSQEAAFFSICDKSLDARVRDNGDRRVGHAGHETPSFPRVFLPPIGRNFDIKSTGLTSEPIS